MSNEKSDVRRTEWNETPEYDSPAELLRRTADMYEKSEGKYDSVCIVGVVGSVGITLQSDGGNLPYLIACLERLRYRLLNMWEDRVTGEVPYVEPVPMTVPSDGEEEETDETS